MALPNEGLCVDRIEMLLKECDLQGGATTEPSIIVKQLGGNGFTFAKNADVPYYPACMIKVPLALVYFHLFDIGEIDQWQTLEVRVRHMTETAPPAPYAPDQENTLLHYLYYALQFSDNVAFNVLLDNLDRMRATQIVRSYGLTATSLCRMLSGHNIIADDRAIGRNQHSPADAARLFELLYCGKAPGAEVMMKYMRKTHASSLTENGMQEGDLWIDKSGYTSDVSHHAAIMGVPGRVPVLMVVYTSMEYSISAVERMKRFKNGLREVIARSDRAVGRSFG